MASSVEFVGVVTLVFVVLVLCGMLLLELLGMLLPLLVLLACRLVLSWLCSSACRLLPAGGWYCWLFHGVIEVACTTPGWSDHASPC